MKKFLPIMVLLGLFAVSCNKAEGPQANENGTYTFVLNASVDQELTRTAYADDDVTFSWSDDDAISVLFHKGEDHKFFTLTTSEGGSATAKFTGEIESGYELGASETEGGVAWALFPANTEHSWNTETHMPDFYAAPEVDFTKSHFSANLPMYANGDAEGSFTFKYLTSCYKFTFTDIDASKVKLTVHSSGSGAWYLSGKSPVKVSGSDVYLQCYDGTGSRDITYIEEVDSKKAVFYVPFRGWEPFTPEITLVDADNGATLLHVTAKDALAAAPFGRIVVLPAKSIGDVPVVIPSINIDGDMSDWADIKGATSDGINAAFKVTSDETNIYFYVKRTTERMSEVWGGAAYHYYTFDLDNDPTTGVELWGNGPFELLLVVYPYAGSADAPAFGIAKAGATMPEDYTVDHAVISGVVTESGVETEIAIPRADLIEMPTTPVTIYNWSNKGGSPKLSVSCTL